MAAGLDVQVSIVAEHLTEQQAYQRERAEIAAERKTRCLTNLFPGMRTDAERALDQVNYNLSRFRTPEQYTFALLRELRRLPTTQEWGWYFESLEWFAELKERLIKELTDDGSPNGLQA